jgi:oligopeptidase B
MHETKASTGAPDLTAPIAPEYPTKSTEHGITRIDPYAWLRDRDNPETIAYLKAENAYTEATLKDSKRLQEKLFNEMLGRIRETDASVPYREGQWWYSTGTRKGLDYSLHYRMKITAADPQKSSRAPSAESLATPEHLYFDENAHAHGKEYYESGVHAPSPDGRLLAFSEDFTGDETYVLRFMDLETGKRMDSEIHETDGDGGVWDASGRTFFYLRLDQTRRPYQLKRHLLGSDPAKDEVLFEEKDEQFSLGLEESQDRQFLFLTSSSKETSEVLFLPTAKPEDPLKVVFPRRKGVEYYLEHWNHRFLVLTNEGAINFRLLSVPADAFHDPEKRNEILPHNPETRLTELLPLKDFLIVFERHRGQDRLRVLSPDEPEQNHVVQMPEEVYVLEEGMNLEFATDRVRLVYSSPITPRRVYDYHLRERRLELLKEKEITGGYRPERFRAYRREFPARDGTPIPVTIVHLRDLPLDGSPPLLLEGYGAYGETFTPDFRLSLLNYLERGFVCAVAHVRGGGLLGEAWYRAGKLEHKKNTFTDFVDIARALHQEGYGTPRKTAINGSSAGGLLIGAALNLSPESFGVAVANVPFVDILNSMLDASLPLTTEEYEEWGNPQEEHYFKIIKEYAPYENIRPAAYPHLLVTVGLNDPRVGFWEGAKWVARLRKNQTGDAQILLKTNLSAGHGGASGRYNALREMAMEQAFVLQHLAKVGKKKKAEDKTNKKPEPH